MSWRLMMGIVVLACSSLARAETCTANVTHVTVNARNGYVQAYLSNGWGWVTLCGLNLPGKAEICKSILSLASGAQLSKQKLMLEYQTACTSMAADGYAAADKLNAVGIAQ